MTYHNTILPNLGQGHWNTCRSWLTYHSALSRVRQHDYLVELAKLSEYYRCYLVSKAKQHFDNLLDLSHYFCAYLWSRTEEYVSELADLQQYSGAYLREAPKRKMQL